MKCIEYRSIARPGVLRGFATIEMDSGIILRDCSYCEQNARRWVSPPAKPQLDKDKQPILKDGKLQYVNIVTFRDRGVGDKWSDQAVKAISEYLQQNWGRD